MKRPEFWRAPSVMGWLLQPLSVIYWAIVSWRLSRCEAHGLPVPVVCIGNNTVGGTGKTPTVLYCCHRLRAMGKNPHVISRGYKGSVQTVLQVDAVRHSADEVGDEPLLIAKQYPCWVAPKRIDAALAAVSAGADVIVMDDGMQNPTIRKRYTIMVVDGPYGFGNRQMLPAGPCREPISVSLEKADALVIIGTPVHDDVASIAPLTDYQFYAQVRLADSAILPDRPVIAFAGIGRPQKFFAFADSLGIQTLRRYAFADHHRFTNAQLEKLRREAEEQRALLLTTEKDWVRLPPDWQACVSYLPIALEIQDETLFNQLLSQAVGS